MRCNRTIFSLGTVQSLCLGMLLLGCGDDDSSVNNANLNNNNISGSCGDGVVDLAAGEECDDGGEDPNDGCGPLCKVERCGDGIVQTWEECDDGNLVNADACHADCSLPACGDGILDLGEGCDDGNNTDGDGCQADCTLPSCGDGVKDSWEQCDCGTDPANLPSGCTQVNSDSAADACRTTCRSPHCGDHVTDAGEQCDDGNYAAGDGCTAQCTIEACGNGILDLGEECDCGADPGNLPAGCTQVNSNTASNACRTSCRLPRCGDAAVDTGEQCDDGNLVNADACHTDCSLPACGDGILDLGEGCDDGNNTDGDGCQADCTLPSCGDGVKDSWEQCDCGTDPANLPTGCTQVNSDSAADACRTTCRSPYCGDHVTDAGEQCDDGNYAVGDGCTAQCTIEACGNGILDLGEECDCGADPGNLPAGCTQVNSNTASNACRTSCRLPRCGDGVLDTGEQCDDGNMALGDGCTGLCNLEACGNGILDLGEECDEGASNSDTAPNACRTSCELPSCGDGVMDDAAPSNESCDGQDFGGVTCLGLVGVDGTLTCRADCSLDLSGCDGLEWIALSGCTYDMGSASISSYTLPVHSVTVPAFSMTKTEVTVRQYGHCVTVGACTAPSTAYTQCNWGASGYEDHPVNCVDWNQAKAFCTWAGGRLPSESEWEYAARSGGQAIDYPWGNATATCTYAVMYEGSNGCGTGRTWAVCGKTAGNTSQGLCDMSGNVWEWVEDDLHSSYTGAPSDGSAWVDNPRGSFRVVRGGSFDCYAGVLRAAFRYYYAPSGQYFVLGFRCSR